MTQKLLLLLIWISASMFFVGNCCLADDSADSSVDELLNGEEKPKLLKESIIKKYAQILAKYVDDDGNVDYNNLRKKRIELIPLLKELEQLHPAEMMSWSKEEKIAFWINTHNILMINLVVENYPIKPKWYMITYPDNSIIHISGGRNKLFFKVMGLEYTLQEIERGILLDGFQEPLVAFGLSYATMGGAFLLNEPYTAEKLYDQLKKQTAKMLSDERGMRIDKENGFVYLTDIFNWHKTLFVKKYGSIKRFRKKNEDIRSYLNCILEHVPNETSKYLTSKDYLVKFQDYNWLLNEQTSK